MPTSTFFNLNKDKREKIINAVKEEFKRRSLIDMSVKNIVEKSGIARGSFYQYFTSREDLIQYILEQEFNEEKSRFILLLKENNCNIFEASYQYLQDMIEENIQSRNYYDHLYKYIKDTRFFPVNQKDVDDVLEFVDMSDVSLNDEKIRAAIKIIITMTHITKNDILNNLITKEQGLKEYKMELELLRNGLIGS